MHPVQTALHFDILNRRCKLRRGCDLDVSETLHVLDDRLFDYVETECSDNDAAGDYLACCVKISDLIRGANSIDI